MDLDDQVTLSVDFPAVPAAGHAAEIGRLCDALEAAARHGRYPLLAVERPWSVHNPRLAPAIDETQWDLRRKKLFLFG
jgi:hypothetical protein